MLVCADALAVKDTIASKTIKYFTVSAPLLILCFVLGY